MITYVLTFSSFSTDQEPFSLDITPDVIRGVSYLTETAFDLNKITTPSDADITLNNVEGRYDLFTGFFNQEITDYIITMSSKQNDVDVVMFTGLISDIQYTDGKAVLKCTSVIRNIINMNIPRPDVGPYSFTGTPSGFIKDILDNQAILPGLFIDDASFFNMNNVEIDLGLNIEVNISDTDKITLADAIQETYKITGLYTYSENGLMKVARLGDFPQVTAENYSYLWNQNQIISDKSRLTRPLEWQKTRWIVPGPLAQLARNMNDYFPEGESILNRFQEKTVETDGLDGRIKHTSNASGIEAMNQLLGWRGFPRYQFTTKVDTIDRENKAQLQAVPLFSINRFEHNGGCFTGVIINKTITETDGELTALSIVDPTISNPYNLIFPTVVNANGKIVISAQTSMKVTYEYGNNSGELLFPDNLQYILENPNLDSIKIRVDSVDSSCGALSGVFQVDAELKSFIVSLSKVGQTI